MTEKRIEGVRIKDTAHKKWEYDYGPGDMRAVYNRGNWQDWQEVIRWLEEFGERDNELTPGETIALVEDLRSAKQKNLKFTSDWQEAYQMAHRFRSENNKKFASEHSQHMSRKKGK